MESMFGYTLDARYRFGTQKTVHCFEHIKSFNHWSWCDHLYGRNEIHLLQIHFFSPPHRNQKANDRWSFSAIVDELLDIVDEVPNSKCVEVGEIAIAAEFTLTSFLDMTITTPLSIYYLHYCMSVCLLMFLYSDITPTYLWPFSCSVSSSAVDSHVLPWIPRTILCVLPTLQ